MGKVVGGGAVWVKCVWGGSSVVSQLLVDKLFAAERYMKRMEPRFLKQQEGGHSTLQLCLSV